jgi:predicted PurR-regulated permease PerM
MRAAAVIAVLLALIVMQLARAVLLPFVLGLMIAALAWPMLRWLQAKVPRPVALLLTILAVTTVLLAVLGAIGWSTASVARDLRSRSDRITSLRQRADSIADQFGVSLPTFGGESSASGSGGEGTSTGPTQPGGAVPTDQAASEGSGSGGGAKRAGVALYSTLGYLGLAVGFAALTLAELRAIRHRIRLRFDPPRADRILGISGEVAAAMRRYFKVKSITSAIAGVSMGLLSLLFGIKFALVWGLLAFLFEYVPTVGSILAVAPPVAYAFVQSDGVAKPLAALGVFTVVQLFLGNYVDPRIEGRLLSISPLVVLLAIVFGAWLWGAPGSLLGVPMVVALTIITRHFESTRWLWAILTEANDDEHGDGGDGDAAASHHRR